MERVELPWQFFALVEGDVQRRFEALRPLFETFDYASFSLGERERSALLIRGARDAAPTAVELDAIDHLLGLDEGPVLAYDDPRRAVGKRVRIEDGRIVALRLAAKPPPGSGCAGSGKAAVRTPNCAAGCWRRSVRHRAMPRSEPTARCATA